ncbi:MAG: RNA-binding S4 domain-containing protein [candidate division Zixibacteria bacterium]|nr:RNA-binding S4 domain-containing protein [candidate division Zixibacteria bacterium]
MRIDLYLSTTGLVKRRTVAREFCDAGKVKLNGKTAKPGKEVKTGDELALSLSSGRKVIEITDIPTKSIRKNEGENYYKLKEFEPKQRKQGF